MPNQIHCDRCIDPGILQQARRCVPQCVKAQFVNHPPLGLMSGLTLILRATNMRWNKPCARKEIVKLPAQTSHSAKSVHALISSWKYRCGQVLASRQLVGDEMHQR